MVEATNEFIVEMIRRIQADVSDLKLDMREIRTRLGHIEIRMGSLSSRMDCRDEHMERVMRRLELTDASH